MLIINILMINKAVSSTAMNQTENEMKALRSCLGQFATGITIVTCADATGHPYGITANSFSSVSLDPALLLWNIAKSSNSLRHFLAAKNFAVHVLRKEQQAASSHFAQSDHSLFDDIEYELSRDNTPLLPNPLARFDCTTEQIHECGDHHIIIGRIDAHHNFGGEPLLYYGGAYRLLD